MTRKIERLRGFTLVEAMVALVIFSMAAMGIYSWINTNLISLNRVAVVAESEFVVNSAMERLKLVDFSQETSGRFNVGGYWVDWKADFIEPWKMGATATGGAGIYDLGLFIVSLSLTRDSLPVATYQYRQVAYKKVRESALLED